MPNVLRPPAARALPLWTTVADAAVLIFVALAIAVAVTGGFVVHPLGMRLSMRSEWRPLIWAVGVALLRHLLVRRPSLWDRARDFGGWMVRAHGPLTSDDVALTAVTSVERRRALTGVAIVALFAALTVAMTYPQVRVLDRGVSPDIADPLLSTWRISWFAHQLPRDPLHLFDANIFYPERSTLAFSDAMLLPSLTAAPLVWLGVPQILAYNLLLLSAFAVSGAAMWLLVYSLTRHMGAALIAGFIFAFLPYRYMHYAHLELQMAQWMPLCLWALHRAVATGRLRDGLLTGAFFAAQTLSSFYYGIFFATFLVPVAIALLFAAPRPRLWPAFRALAAGAVLAGAIVAPVTKPYFDARRSVGERPLSEVEFYSATPQNYLAAHPRNAAFGQITAGWGGQERELFQGVAVPMIAAVGLWPPISAVRMGYAVGLALAFELSLGTNGQVYTVFRSYVLPYRGLRVPARMAIVVGLSLAILAGYGVARLCRRWPSPRASSAICAVLGLVVFAEYRSVLTLKDVWTSPSPIYDSLASAPDAVLLELPLIAPDVALEPIYMYFSTFHWHRLVNGYSGFSPPSYMQLLRDMAAFPEGSTIDELRRRGVTHVVVHGAFYTHEELRDLTAKLDACPSLELVTAVRWEVSQTRLYRLK